jgi:SAM-dependent methyltransferase
LVASQSSSRPQREAQRAQGKWQKAKTAPEGFEGWDDYAPFYDWENARTLGRRDVPFWRNLSRHVGGRVLELGSGTGRVTIPLGRAGVSVVGIDRSTPMLDRARQRVRRGRLQSRVRLVRGDIRDLPFRAPDVSRRSSRSEGGPFSMVMAPYGVLQSLLREKDLAATLAAVYGALERGGTFGIDLVADLPSWEEYRRRISLTGWRARRGGSHVTLVETVRQDRGRGVTVFDQEFTERRGRTARTHRFALTFRTLSVPQMTRRLKKAGFEITALLGDYRGGAWDARAEVWVILAKKP